MLVVTMLAGACLLLWFPASVHLWSLLASCQMPFAHLVWATSSCQLAIGARSLTQAQVLAAVSTRQLMEHATGSQLRCLNAHDGLL
jgi:hypothetical protein